METFCRLHGEVNSEMYEKLLGSVKRAFEKRAKSLIIHINSPGGSMESAVKISELLFFCKKLGIETYAVGYKNVHSAALLIYLSCIFRIAYKETKFLIHNARPVDSDNDEDYKVLEKEFYDFFSETTKITVEKFSALAKRSTYISYDFAFANKIVNLEWSKNLLSA